jgi:regulatory protein
MHQPIRVIVSDYQEQSHQALVAATRFLGYRARTVSEIRTYLGRKGFLAEAIENAVVRLGQMGYLNDAEYAREFVATQVRTSAMSVDAIRRRLQSRGVDPEIVADCVDSVGSDYDFNTAAKLAARAWSRNSADAPDKRRRKVLGLLARRGFPASLSYEVIRSLDAGDSD